MENIYQDIYLKELPLPNNPLKYLNLYIVHGRGKTKSMIVDTGFNREDTKAEILSVMQELKLDFTDTFLYLTHLHSDHVGLAGFFHDKGMDVYISKIDGDLVNASLEEEDPVWQRTKKRAIQQGLAEDQLDLSDHPGFKFRPNYRLDFKEAIPGEELQVGEYTFEIMDFKGHTPGITGLYEKKHKLLFCGDHILGKITPNITYWGENFPDSLGEYLKSLDRCYDLDVDHLFSSHRHLVDDHRERIRELRNHHKERINEARETLRKTGEATVRDVTKAMHWDIRAKSWDDFPKSQKWFAAGEAHAHLEYLRHAGEARVEERDGILYYSLVSGK